MSRENVRQGYRITSTTVKTTRQHRTLDERILVRFPALTRGLGSAWSRLPTRYRPRRLLLLRFAAQAASALNRRDFEALFYVLDPDIDWRIVSTPAGEIPPDLIGHHYGHAGYREMWRTLLDGFKDLRLDPEEIIDLGDHVISRARLSGHGAGGAIPVSVVLFQLFMFRRGLVVRQQDFATLDEALKAAGLRE